MTVTNLPTLRTALLKFIDAFDDHGYGQSSGMSYPDEWNDLIAFARKERQWGRFESNCVPCGKLLQTIRPVDKNGRPEFDTPTPDKCSQCEEP